MKEIEITIEEFTTTNLILKSTEVWVRLIISGDYEKYGLTKENNSAKIKVPGYELRHSDFLDVNLVVVNGYKRDGNGGFDRVDTWRMVNGLTGGNLSPGRFRTIEEAVERTLRRIKENPKLISAEALITGVAKLHLAKPLELKP